MLIYQETYGEDIDGNRGILQWNYELEEFDYDEVQEKVLDYIWQRGLTLEEVPKTVPVDMYDYINDEVVTLQVVTRDYLPKED